MLNYYHFVASHQSFSPSVLYLSSVPVLDPCHCVCNTSCTAGATANREKVTMYLECNMCLITMINKEIDAIVMVKDVHCHDCVCCVLVRNKTQCAHSVRGFAALGVTTEHSVLA